MSDDPDNEHAFTAALLGETADEFRLDDTAQAAAAALALARQARRGLRIFTRDMEPALIGTEAFAGAAGAMARRNRHTFIRILVQDPGPALRTHHRLLPLIQALPTHVAARRVAEEWSRETFAFIVADDAGLLYRPYADRPAGTVCFAARARAAERRDWFDDVWERSLPEREFRRLGI